MSTYSNEKNWNPVRGASLFAAVCMMTAATSALAQDAGESARVDELERRIDVLARELERDQLGSVFRPVGESRYGLGPAASKVYAVEEQGLSIGGYGEGLYQNFEGDKTDQADFLRAILYVGYKYNEKWVLNTEIELEHADSAFVEFATLDYLHDPALNVRAGLMLIPMGLVNELHEPVSFLGARRPDVESRIIPSTWRENGVGVFGDIGPFQYKAYLVNGLEGADFSPEGLRGGRQKGSKALAEDLAGVASLNWTPATGVLLGGSAYYGDSGQDLDVALNLSMVEGHVDIKKHGWNLRALVVQAQLDDVAAFNRIRATGEDGVVPADSAIESVGETLFGWYAEAGYDVLNVLDTGELSLIPFVRYEELNTQEETPAGFKVSGENELDIVTLGVNVKPIDELVFKAEYQVFDNEADTADNQFNLSMGYVF